MYVNLILMLSLFFCDKPPWVKIISAYDGPICCLSLQKLSKWFAINGWCPCSPLVCVAWYFLFLIDIWFHLQLSLFNKIAYFVTFVAGPVDESRNHLPDILCVLQVYLCGCLKFEFDVAFIRRCLLSPLMVLIIVY